MICSLVGGEREGEEREGGGKKRSTSLTACALRAVALNEICTVYSLSRGKMALRLPGGVNCKEIR